MAVASTNACDAGSSTTGVYVVVTDMETVLSVGGGSSEDRKAHGSVAEASWANTVGVALLLPAIALAWRAPRLDCSKTTRGEARPGLTLRRCGRQALAVSAVSAGAPTWWFAQSSA